MTYEEKSEIVISQLRADRDRLQDAVDKIREEIRQEQEGYPPSADEYKTITKVLRIIDKHIRKEPEPAYRQDNKYRKNNHQNFKKEDCTKKGGLND